MVDSIFDDIDRFLSTANRDRRDEGLIKDGILGSFHFDRNGDIDPPVMPIERLAATRRGAPIKGAVFDRMITIPEALARP